MDITREKSLFVFSNVQEVSQTLRIPAKAIHAVCQGRERSTHGISFRWFHPDCESQPDGLVSASKVRRDFMESKSKGRRGTLGTDEGHSGGEEGDEGDEEGVDVATSTQSRAPLRKKSKQSKRKKVRYNVEDNFNIRGKANVPIRKTAMIAVSSRTGRARKLTYQGDYAYEGNGLGVDDAMLQTQDRYGELRTVTKKRKKTPTDVHVERKADKYKVINITAASLSDLQLPPNRLPQTDLSTLRSYVGSTFMDAAKSTSACAKNGKSTRKLASVRKQAHRELYKVTALCVNKKIQSVLFFKYYSLQKYPNHCPLRENQYKFSDCMEMMGDDSWAKWTATSQVATGIEEDLLEESSQSSGGETSSNDESDHDMNQEGEFKRPKARYLFASRVFEAAQVTIIT